MGAVHEYLSTACAHDECGSCRQSCKFCTAPCRHGCHPRDKSTPAQVSWVDQARGIALRLYAALPTLGVHLAEVDPHLERAIREDPSLFWMRGDVQPPGQWRDTNRDAL